MTNLNLEIGQIIKYYPEELSADVESNVGTIYEHVPFLTSSSIIVGPLEPQIKEYTIENINAQVSASAKEIIKTGSFVILAKLYNTDKVVILSLLNDDLSVLGTEGVGVSRSKNFPLLSLVEAGDTLITALGRYEEDPFIPIDDTFNRYKRMYGSWLLLKYFGDAILSSANSTSRVWLCHTGEVKIQGSTYELFGRHSSIYENAEGDCVLSRGNGIQDENCYLKFSKDNNLVIKTPGIEIKEESGSLTTYVNDNNVISKTQFENVLDDSKIIENGDYTYTNYSLTSSVVYISANVYDKAIANITEHIEEDTYTIILAKVDSNSNPEYSINVMDKSSVKINKDNINLAVEDAKIDLSKDSIGIEVDNVKLSAKKVEIEVEGNKLIIDSSGVSIKPTTSVNVGDAPNFYAVVAQAPGSGPAAWGQLLLSSKIKVSL
jgi:hypothetical protein